MDRSDDDPHPPAIDTSEFLLDGSGLSALLIHGLTGTPYEMRFLGDQMAAASIRVHGVKLAGHSESPEALGTVTDANWYESVVDGFERLRAYGDPIVVIGLSMGGVLAARLAIEQGEALAAIVMLAPAFFLPRPARMLLWAIRPAAKLANRVYLHKPGGSEIHDAAARRIHPGNHLLPLKAALSLTELSANVRPKLGEIDQPALLIHARKDRTCPFEKNTRFVMRHLGSSRKRLVALEESYHVITVDSEKERVAREVTEFVSEFRAVPTASAARC
jgi:carboxylesterase